MEPAECGRALNATVTTRLLRSGLAAGAARWVAGGAVARQHRGAWFLTGLLGAAPPEGPGPLLLIKVPRLRALAAPSHAAAEPTERRPIRGVAGNRRGRGAATAPSSGTPV